jgi:hypothetical protein
MNVEIPPVSFHGAKGIGPVPEGIDACPGTGFNGGKLFNPGADRDILNTDPPGTSFTLHFLKVGNQGHGGGFRGGFCPEVSVLGKFFREMLQAPAVPVFAYTVRKPAGRVKGEPERFGIRSSNDGKRFGRFGHSILFFSKE